MAQKILGYEEQTAEHTRKQSAMNVRYSQALNALNTDSLIILRDKTSEQLRPQHGTHDSVNITIVSVNISRRTDSK